MASLEVPFNFEAPMAKPTEERPDSYSHAGGDEAHPPQSPDSDEYLCGQTGNAHPYANPGRDQDRSRMDEGVPAIGCARYVS